MKRNLKDIFEEKGDTWLCSSLEEQWEREDTTVDKGKEKSS